jgi:hypothetical protein
MTLIDKLRAWLARSYIDRHAGPSERRSNAAVQVDSHHPASQMLCAVPPSCET